MVTMVVCCILPLDTIYCDSIARISLANTKCWCECAFRRQRDAWRRVATHNMGVVHRQAELDMAERC